MAHPRHHTQQFEPKCSSCILLLSLLINTVLRPCGSTQTCPTVPTLTTVSPYVGDARGDECSTISAKAIDCKLQCAFRPHCKLVTLEFLKGQDGASTCKLCERVEGVDFSDQLNTFYLNNQEIGANVRTVELPGGLVAGQPLMMKFLLQTYYIKLSFSNADHDQRIITRIETHTSKVETMSNTSAGVTVEHTTTDATLAIFKDISVLYIVNSTHYSLYFDQVLFHTFPQRSPLHELLFFKISGSSDLLRVITFRR